VLVTRGNSFRFYRRISACNTAFADFPNSYPRVMGSRYTTLRASLSFDDTADSSVDLFAMISARVVFKEVVS